MGRRRGLEFCCCAVPLVNAGAYLLVAECAFVAIVVGVLALAPPSIVATMGGIPNWSKAIVAVLGFVTFAWQVLGLISVAKENTSLYRAYIRVNFLLTFFIILTTAIFYAVAASRHKDVVQTCYNNFTRPVTINNAPVDARTRQSAEDVCSILIWIQVGVMGGLLVLIGLTQLYMCYAQRVYGQRQREASAISKEQQGAVDHIPLAARDSAVWEPRNDPDYSRDAPHNHVEAPSGAYAAYDSYDPNHNTSGYNRYHD